MSKIFISYRRDDSQAWAGRLSDHIERGFRPEQIFMDIDMEPGVDFVEELEAAVESCDVLLAVIGPQWLTVTDEAGRRRLDNEQEDWVRLEIATALRRRVRVIPCLVEGTRLPRAAELPDELAGLARRQAVPISHERFHSDAERLTRAIAKILDRDAEPATPRRSKSPEPALSPAGTIKQNPQDGLEYVWIPPGKFQMGAVPGDDEARDHEKPQHLVEITKGFWLSRTPVTVAAYKCFVEATSRKMPKAPLFNASWRKEDHPIVEVDWNDAVAYCKWAGGRLPTEAEWEYAARGGKKGQKYPWGNQISSRNAKYHSTDGTASVGSYAANKFDLYDMAGNVWEWCADYHGGYSSSPSRDPKGPPSGIVRVLRGGSWYSYAWGLRCSYRYDLEPANRYVNMGFRCVREASP